MTPIHRSRSTTLVNIVLKLAGFLLVLWGAEILHPRLYPHVWPILATAVVLTAVGVIAEPILLPRLQNLPSLLIGLPGMVFIIWFIAQIWPETHVSLGAATTMTVALGPLEFILHKYLLGARTV